MYTNSYTERQIMRKSKLFSENYEKTSESDVFVGKFRKIVGKLSDYPREIRNFSMNFGKTFS